MASSSCGPLLGYLFVNYGPNSAPIFCEALEDMHRSHSIVLPWEPTTFIFRGYNPYIGGVKHSFLMVLGSKGSEFMSTFLSWAFFRCDIRIICSK